MFTDGFEIALAERLDMALGTLDARITAAGQLAAEGRLDASCDYDVIPDAT